MSSQKWEADAVEDMEGKRAVVESMKTMGKIKF